MPPAAPPFEVSKLAAVVREVVHASAGPLDLKGVKVALKAAGVPVTGKGKVSDEQIRRELEAGGFHAHPAANPGGQPRYHHKPPLTVAEQVEAAVHAKLAALGDGPLTPAQLGKPGGRSPSPEAVAAFDAVVARLLEDGKLFKLGAKFTNREPPRPKWYEAAAHKADYNKLAAAATKLIDAGSVTLDQIVAALREKFGVARVSVPPVVAPPPAVAPPIAGAVAPELGAALEAAYDYLCGFVEFRDRLVELPRLYHEARKRLPTLTVEAFHDELTRLSQAYRLELHVLNEVSTAEEPHLAITRDDRLYYYARWK